MSDEFLALLRADGTVRHAGATLTPLTGGVSSEIYLVRDGEERFVVKRALAKLNVPDDWFADVGRNAYEVEYLRTAGALVPGAVPTLRTAPPGHGYFAMEFLKAGFENWKALMLRGVAEEAHARAAGEVLGTIHRETWDDAAVRRRFDTTAGFRELRTDPYLLTTGRRHPDLEGLFAEEVGRIERNRRCLVHGDFSPKNMLIRGERLVVLDCEVAWFGDPTFDAGFLLNHLFLKALHRPGQRGRQLKMVRAFWAAYSARLGPERAAEVGRALPRLLLMLMLARVDGKSPVEYLRDDEAAKATIRDFTTRHLRRVPGSLEELTALWGSRLEEIL